MELSIVDSILLLIVALWVMAGFSAMAHWVDLGGVPEAWRKARVERALLGGLPGAQRGEPVSGEPRLLLSWEGEQGPGQWVAVEPEVALAAAAGEAVEARVGRGRWSGREEASAARLRDDGSERSGV